MGQIVEWPEVITEGENLQDCRESLMDALREMIIASRQLGQEVPEAEGFLEPISVEA
jgi:predicted RNase H-like HicB family nuclease